MKLPVIAIALLAGCGDDAVHHLPDGPPPADARAADAAPDAPADAPCRVALYTGGTDPTATGWTYTQQGPATATVEATDVKLATTSTGGATGGQLLMTYPAALPTAPPYGFEVELAVDSVVAHNPLDAAAAILPAFTPPFGTTAERSAMIYLDAGKLGFADDTAAAPATIADGNFHVVRVTVDAAGAETVAFDGTAVLARANATTNGTLAIGDQTNEAGTDATLRIRAVTRLACLP